MLGGTGFIGPHHHVRAAITRGHRVSVFNRGKSPADIPAEVERLVGDRNGDLESIKNRDWDAVIDLQTYSPGWVRTLGQALRGRVKHYTFISTVMTYARSADVVDENSAVLQQTDAIDPYGVQPSGWVQYGAFKVLCEREGETQFPRRTLVVRPGVITGPGDDADHIAYWFARMERGGEILLGKLCTGSCS
jgi:2'-hydroxyisoflavone reductase